MQKLKWQIAGGERFTELEDIFGIVSFVGEDMFGNKIYEASVFDKAKKTNLLFTEVNYIEDGIKAVETAIRRATR